MCDGVKEPERLNAKLSVAIPLYNEAGSIAELIARTTAILDRIPGGPHEIVFVDDGSSDRTFELLEKACTSDSRLTALNLSRNFGHQAALSAALDHVTGDVVAVMDGDLQDPPEAIPLLLDRYYQGYDVVFAVRKDRKEGPILRLCYSLFYRTIALIAHVNLPLGAGDFGLMSRQVVDTIRAMREQRPYLRGLRAWVGFSQIGVPIERGRRHAGRSKYNWRRLLALAFDGIFSFSIVPIRIAFLIGVWAIMLSMAYAFYAILMKLFYHESPQGFTALIVAVTFLSGIQMLFVGIIGEYIGRIFEEVKQRPRYVIRRVVGVP